jgi:putative phosphoribosyl transferase
VSEIVLQSSENVRIYHDFLSVWDREKRLEVNPGATHLFEEPGKLEEVARLATGWFVKHLKPSAS